MTGYTANYRHIITTDAGDEEGDCLHIRTGYHHVIEGFPNCVVADAVINFFMARTEKIQKVTFDPRLARVGHLGEMTNIYFKRQINEFVSFIITGIESIIITYISEL